MNESLQLTVISLQEAIYDMAPTFIAHAYHMTGHKCKYLQRSYANFGWCGVVWCLPCKPLFTA